MLLRFSLDNIEEELAQLLIARPSPQRLHDVELEITSEAGSQFPVTGETEFVTALAEMQVSHRPDEADALGAAWDLIVAGRPIRAELGLREQRAKLPFDRASRFGYREEVGLGKTSVVLTGINSMNRSRRPRSAAKSISAASPL